MLRARAAQILPREHYFERCNAASRAVIRNVRSKISPRNSQVGDKSTLHSFLREVRFNRRGSWGAQVRWSVHLPKRHIEPYQWQWWRASGPFS